MASYRLYLVSELTRRFEPGRELQADDDKMAIALAEAERDGRGAELWSGCRLVQDWRVSGGGNRETNATIMRVGDAEYSRAPQA